jgi:hypothetical protein
MRYSTLKNMFKLRRGSTPLIVGDKVTYYGDEYSVNAQSDGIEGIISAVSKDGRWFCVSNKTSHTCITMTQPQKPLTMLINGNKTQYRP